VAGLAYSQFSFQAKKCSMGYIVSIKVCVVSPDAAGVKWHIVLEDVITEPETRGTLRDISKTMLSAISSKI
jgi:hypothetical protein